MLGSSEEQVFSYFLLLFISKITFATMAKLLVARGNPKTLTFSALAPMSGCSV